MTMKNVCPLCFTQLEEGEDKLRLHLTGADGSGCPKHPRAKYIPVHYFILFPFYD